MSDNENLTNLTSQAPAPGPRSRRRKSRRRLTPPMIAVLVVCCVVFAGSMAYIIRDATQQRQIGKEQDNVIDIAFPSDSGYTDVNETDWTGDTNLNPDDKVGMDTSSKTQGTYQIRGVDQINLEDIRYFQDPNWNNLRSKNGDTVAWLYMPTTYEVLGLPFNTSVVQTGDNDYYLSHAFSKAENENGWVFADYRNNMATVTDNYNTILYGHARSYFMFGGLKYLNEKKEWYNDAQNHFVYINTPTQRTVWQIFSWYETTVDHYYIQTNFSSGQEFVDFVNDLQSRNRIAAFQKFEFNENSRILTFSTCKGTDKNKRVAMHAVLVKWENIG